MKKCGFLFLMFIAYMAQAQTVWHKPEVQWNRSTADSIPAVEEYTVMTVFRSLEPDTLELIWGITERDTLRRGILTNGVFAPTIGLGTFTHKRDFSRWSIYYYRTGCHMDTARHYALHFGSAMAYYTKDSIAHADSLPSAIEMEEFAWFPHAITRHESATFLTYLALKYGITLDEQASYIAPSGDTLWSSTADKDYYHRIVGIGIDTLHSWAATTSSTKESAKMLVSCGALHTGDYIIIGDNDGENTWILQPDGNYRMERQWRLRSTATNIPVVLSWKPGTEDLASDSVWLVITDASERQIGRHRPSEIVGDSLLRFPILLTDTLLTLQIESTGQQITRRNKAPRNSSNTSSEKGLKSRYDAQGRIIVEGLMAYETYDFYLYDSTGKLVQTLQNVVGGSALTGTLPSGVYHIEITQYNNIIGDVRVVVK